MSKKSMGLGKANDYGAAMRANAAALMPEVANLSAASKPRAPSPGKKTGAMPNMNKGGACYAKGGAVKLAAGGVAKTRKGVASPKGAPVPPKVKFHGKAGVRGG